MILVVRLVTSWAQFEYYSAESESLIITIMFFSFFLSELCPLFLVVCGIYVQVDWKKVKEQQKQSLSVNHSTNGGSLATDPLATFESTSSLMEGLRSGGSLFKDNKQK